MSGSRMTMASGWLLTCWQSCCSMVKVVVCVTCFKFDEQISIQKASRTEEVKALVLVLILAALGGPS